MSLSLRLSSSWLRKMELLYFASLLPLLIRMQLNLQLW